MTVPLILLAACSILLGFVGTPAWPWFESFLTGHSAHFEFGKLFESEVLLTMLVSSAIVAVGIGLGWWLYGRKPVPAANELDVLEQLRPDLFTLLRRKFFVDEIYEYSVVRLNAWWARTCEWLDDVVWNGAVQFVSYFVIGLSWVNRFFDEYVVNKVFDESCRRIAGSGGLMSRLQNGKIQSYLRFIGIALTVLVLFLIWGCRGS
jgi:NADH-quinone oxidoreductase subunit L